MSDYLFDDYTADILCGVDEAGRGTWAGPLVVGAVILDKDRPIEGLRDSKKLSREQREKLAPLIKERARAWATIVVSASDIDKSDILAATMQAMRQAVLSLPIEPELVIVDGNRTPVLPYRVEPIVHGDDRMEVISAASILAKVHHDELMLEIDKQFPGYGFANHMGYGTAEHIEALARFGPCPEHRFSYEPVANCVKHHEKPSH